MRLNRLPVVVQPFYLADISVISGQQKLPSMLANDQRRMGIVKSAGPESLRHSFVKPVGIRASRRPEIDMKGPSLLVVAQGNSCGCDMNVSQFIRNDVRSHRGEV
jgi:hypothetical protein